MATTVPSLSSSHRLPQYAEQLAAFHRAFAYELKAIVASLPLSPHMRVLDVGCGDGFYLGLFAERLLSPGGVIGLDINPAFLAEARNNPALANARCEVELVRGEVKDTGQQRDCDLVWCAQSLYSLPEPVSALRQMSATLRPGGIVAVLENDTLHQLLLPWPSHLELALRAAEYATLCDESRRPSKFYVGRRLPSVFAAAGLEPLSFRTQCIDRRAPLDGDLASFLQSYLERLSERVSHRLDSTLRAELAALIDPQGSSYLLNDPYFTMSWLNVLVWGRGPLES